MQLRERLFVPFLLLLHFGVLVHGQQLPGVLPGVVQNLANNPLPTIASPQPLNTTSATIQQGALAQAAGLIAGVQPASPSQGPTSYQQPVAYPQQSPQQGYAQQGYAQPSYPQAPQTYAQPPPSYVQPPQGYVQPPQGYAQPPPPSYVQPPQASYVQPQGYAQPQASYVQPSSYAQPQSYAQPPASYPQPHNTYVQPQSYAQAPNSYAQAQTGYAQPQSGYAQPPSYVQPAASYAQPQGCSQGGGCGGSRGASLPDLWSVPFETNSNGYLVFQENGRKKGGCQCCDGEVEVPVKNSACESQCRAHGKRPCEETDDASGEEDNDCGLLLLVRQPCKNCGGGRAVPSFLCPNEQRPTVPCPRSRCGLSYRSRRALPAV